MKPTTKARTGNAFVRADSESEPEPAPEKRTRSSGGRALRSQGGSSAPTPSGRSARAAKLQANKKLDAQAKELAEFQRQAVLSTSPGKFSPRSSRRSWNNVTVNEASSRKPTMGTRLSARLRGTSRADDDDDEWQQVPEEWLNETIGSSASNHARLTRQGKARRKSVRLPLSQNEDAVENGPHTGLSSDDGISDLTELSGDEQSEPVTQASNKLEGNESPLQGLENTLVEGTVPKEKEREEIVDIPTDGLTVDTLSHIPADFVEWEAVSPL